MSVIAFDIETVVSEEGKKLISQMEIKAPANYKDQEKISAYIEEKKKDLLDKAALYWWLGQIVCISAVNVFNGEKFICLDKDEKNVVEQFLKFLEAKKPTALIGKNSEDFDLPWVRAKAMRYDLGLHYALRLERPIRDVQKIFGHSINSSQVTSLKNMAVGLSLSGEKQMSGGEVAKLWADNKHGAIMEYCLNDSMLTGEIYRRYDKMFVAAEG